MPTAAGIWTPEQHCSHWRLMQMREDTESMHTDIKCVLCLCAVTGSLPFVQMLIPCVTFLPGLPSRLTKPLHVSPEASFWLFSSVMGRTTLSSWGTKVNGYRLPSCLFLLDLTRLFHYWARRALQSLLQRVLQCCSSIDIQFIRNRPEMRKCL